MKKLLLLFCTLLFIVSVFAQKWTALDKVNLELVKGKYSKAYALADSTLKESPQDMNMVYVKGLALKKLSKEKEALNFLSTYVSSDSCTIPIFQMYGELLYERKHYDSARSVFCHVYNNIDSTLLDNGIWLGKSHDKLQQWEKSEVLYKFLTTLDQENTYLKFRLANALVELKKGKEAIPVLEKTLLIDNEHDNARYLLTKIYLALDKDEIALQHVDTLQMQDSTNARWYLLAGNIHAGNNHYFQALPQFLKATQLPDPYTFNEAMQRTGTSYYKINKFKEALPYLHHNIDFMGTPEVYFHIGVCYERLGDIDKAFASYEKSHALSMPDGFLINSNHIALANICIEREQYGEAITLLERALILTKGLLHEQYIHIQLVEKIADIYINNMKDYEKARSLYQEQLAKISERGNPHLFEMYTKRIEKINEELFFKGQ